MFSKSSLSYLDKVQIKKLKLLTKNISEKKLRSEVLKGNLPRPQFALGLYMSFLQSSQLNIRSITVLEFNFLDDQDSIQDLIAYCKIYKKIFSIDFKIYSLRYSYTKNKYSKYDRLYLINNIKNKSKNFLRKNFSKYFVDADKKKEINKIINTNLKHSPIGFCSFDLRNYSYTNKALSLLKENQEYFLPRTILYFDHFFKSSFYEGENLSINKFNQTSNKKISEILELPEQLSLHWQKWIFLAKRFKILSNFENSNYQKKCEKFF